MRPNFKNIDIKNAGFAATNAAEWAKANGMVSMKDANVHGDHYATIEIAVPRSLNRTARQKLMEYKEAC